MNLKKITKWLAISALVGAMVAFLAFQEASIQIDGKTLSLEEFIEMEIRDGE